MTDFNPEKLSVNYKDFCNEKGPLKGRKYSLSHSDETGDLFLTIGNNFYYYDNQTVLAELKKVSNDEYNYLVYLYLDGDKDVNPKQTAIRDKIFREHLSLALKAMIYGDKKFLTNNGLLDSYVVVHFKSKYCKYNVVQQWGYVSKYLL